MWFIVHVQDAFHPIPGLTNYAGVTGRWGLLSLAQIAVRSQVLLTRLVQVPLCTCTQPALNQYHTTQADSDDFS